MTFGGIFIVGFFLINLVTVDWLSVCRGGVAFAFPSGYLKWVEVQLSALVFCWLILGLVYLL